MIRKNYESDFEVTILLPDVVGDADFIIEFATRGTKIYSASRTGGKYTPNLRRDSTEENKYHVVLRKHELPTGMLKVKVYALLKYYHSPDGIMQEVTPLTKLDIELWDGLSDEIDLPSVELPTQILIERYSEKLKFVATDDTEYTVFVGTKEGKNDSDYGYGYYYYEAEGIGMFDELSEIE